MPFDVSELQNTNHLFVISLVEWGLGKGVPDAKFFALHTATFVASTTSVVFAVFHAQLYISKILVILLCGCKPPISHSSFVL